MFLIWVAWCRTQRPSPWATLNQSIAMAYVDSLFVQPGLSCEVDVRGKTEPARVVPLPFYSRKKS